MKELTPAQIEKRYAQQQAMQERARAKQRAKQADPEWQREQREKQSVRQQRYAARAREKQADKFRTATIAQQDSIDDYSNESLPQLPEDPRLTALARIDPKPPKQPQRKPAKRTSTRGLKGRTPLAHERNLADQLAKLPCIACLAHGKVSHVISLHHMHGRTVLGAHETQLPLCTWHHQELAPVEIRRAHPWLIPFHAAGKHGGKREWERLNGTQEDLYQRCLVLIADGTTFEAVA